jgi:DNA-binding transcriptional ArsR family regulator
MVRLWLGAADVARIRFVTRLHPLGLAVIGSQALRQPAATAVLPRLRARHEEVAASVPALFELVPTTGLLPDFLTPMEGVGSLAAGIEAVRATRAEQIRGELADAYAKVPATPLRRRLASGDRDTLEVLVTALGRYFKAVFAPDLALLTRLLHIHVARHAETLALSGVDGLLAGLHPAIRWRPPMLEVDTWWTGDASPDGRGVLLVPSAFAGPRPRLQVFPDGPVLVVYPVPTLLTRAGPGGDALCGLLGRTRAAVLRTLVMSGRHTTTLLAGAVGISPASASEHAAALRAAGLVNSEREGRAMVHRLTPLGLDLVASNDA